MKRQRLIWLESAAVFLALLSSPVTLAADIHIDPSRSNGCPGQGTLEVPYCSWNEVGPLRGGNRYLQRRGTVFNGGVKVTRAKGLSAADLAGELFIGAYGEGAVRPVIRVENPLPGGQEPTNWRLVGPGIWAYATAGFKFPDPRVLFLDGRRAFGPAGDRADLCTRHGGQRVDWMHAAEELLLCSPRGNPAVVFGHISGMQARQGEPWIPVYIEGRRRVVIDGLTLEGGGWGSVQIRAGAADVEIRNCDVGRDGIHGIYVSADQTGMISGINIHHNRIDSGVRWGAVSYEPIGRTGEGVYFSQSVKDSRIHYNEIVAWTHNGIYLNASRRGDPGVTDNLVDHNDIHCGLLSSYFDYCRPFGIDGWRAGAASGNAFFANRLHDFSLGAQVNGDRNFVIGNYCYNVVNSGVRKYPTGMCFRMQAYVFSQDNLIAFNTMANTADAAIEFIPGKGGMTAGHRVVGNIFHGCARDAPPARRDACIAMSAAPEVGFQLIKDNLFFNPGDRPVRILYRSQWAVELSRWKPSEGDHVLGNRMADPLFTNPQTGDFSLAWDSPARGRVPVLEVPGLAGQPVALGAWQGAAAGETIWRLMP